MTPRPNTSVLEESREPPSGQEGITTTHSISLNTVQKIKDFLQDQISFVSLKPYDDSPKDWEAVVMNGYNISEKIQKFEERIRNLNEENNSLVIPRVRRSDCNGQGFLRLGDSLNGLSSGDLSSIGSSDCVNDCGNDSLDTVSKANVDHMLNSMNGNGSLNNDSLTLKTEDTHQNRKMDQNLKKILSIYLHICASYALYLVLTGQFNSWNTIFLAMMSFIISCRVRFSSPESFTIRNRSWRFLVSLVHPMVIEDSSYNQHEKKLVPEAKYKIVANMSPMHESEGGYISNQSEPKKMEWISGNALLIKTTIIILAMPVWAVIVPWLFWTETLLTSFMIVGQLQNCISLYTNSLIRNYLISKSFDKEK